MDILTEIVTYTKKLVQDRKESTPLSALEAEIAKRPATLSLLDGFDTDAPRVIAEFKRKSPSRPNINLAADPVAIAKAYHAGGAAAMSVLTEPGYFGGQLDDLVQIRAAVPELPLLRKDFMVDPYQFYEARAAGADLILLIARILTKAELADYCQLAHELGLQVLCEVHNLEELAHVGDTPVDFLGVNCRDLKKFVTNLDHLVEMSQHLPENTPWVAESGIHSPEDLKRLKDCGYQGFLIGEYLMKSESPTQTLANLVAL